MLTLIPFTTLQYTYYLQALYCCLPSLSIHSYMSSANDFNSIASNILSFPQPEFYWFAFNKPCTNASTNLCCILLFLANNTQPPAKRPSTKDCSANITVSLASKFATLAIIFLICPSIYTLNSHGDRAHPCLPHQHKLFHLTSHSDVQKHAHTWIRPDLQPKCPPTPYNIRLSHKASHINSVTAFSMSKKAAYNHLSFSTYISIIMICDSLSFRKTPLFITYTFISYYHSPNS